MIQMQFGQASEYVEILEEMWQMGFTREFQVSDWRFLIFVLQSATCNPEGKTT